MAGETVAGDERNAVERQESRANPRGSVDATDSKPRYAATRHQTETGAFGDVFAQVETEPADPPADPEGVNHDQRRETPLAPEYREEDSLPKPLQVCGCEEGCPDRYDPLADELDSETQAFDDILSREKMAADECPSPQPMSVGRAAEAYFRYQIAADRHEDMTSRLERISTDHGRYLDAERQLLGGLDDPSTALLSLRVSPLEGGSGSERDNYGITAKSPESMYPESDQNGETLCSDRGRGGAESEPESERDYYGITAKNRPESLHPEPTYPESESESMRPASSGRDWVAPLRLEERIKDSFKTAKETLRYHLREFDRWEYLWLVSTTDSAATPHLHVYIWVEDPDDALSVEHCRPAVESYVENTTGAYPEHHRVQPEESDAAVIEHDPAHISYEPSEDRQIGAETDAERPHPNTRGMTYLLNQRPDWALRRVEEGQSTREEEQTQLEGAAIAWASPNKWVGSSTGFRLPQATAK